MLHGNAKTDEELEMAVKYGVGLVVVDNFDDIDRLERIVPAGRQQLLVRVIPGVEPPPMPPRPPGTPAPSSG